MSRSATRTVLFTDLANYTARVSNTNREGLRAILAEHARLVQPVVKTHGGRVVKNIGDSFMCLFRSATDALKASLEIIAEAGKDDPSSIRISLATGDVEEIDRDAFGETVNLAARILERTPAGEIWFSLGTHVCMNSSEVPWEDVGAFSLKGLPGEHPCFRLVCEHSVWLPAPILEAIRENRLIRVKPNETCDKLPANPVLLLEGFESDPKTLERALCVLPVVSPADRFLAAYTLSQADREAWTTLGSGLVIGSTTSLEALIKLEYLRGSDTGLGEESMDLSETMTITHHRLKPVLEISLGGLALPSVPFSDLVDGYCYDLNSDGNWVSRAEHPLLRVDVHAQGVWLKILSAGIQFEERQLQSGEEISLSDTAQIKTPAGIYTYSRLNNGYCGLIVGPQGASLGLQEGQTAELGRQPRPPGLAFPIRRGGRIRWSSGPRAAEARESGFSLDRVLAGRRQASISISDGNIVIQSLHNRCPTYLFDEGSLKRVDSTSDAQVGDLIVAGTSVVSLRQPS